MLGKFLLVGVLMLFLILGITLALPYNAQKYNSGGYEGASVFMRGDANDDGKVDVSDAIKILNVLFKGESSSCFDALDPNDDGYVDLSDAIYILKFLFRGGNSIPAPFSERGLDPTPDELDC